MITARAEEYILLNELDRSTGGLVRFFDYAGSTSKLQDGLPTSVAARGGVQQVGKFYRARSRLAG